MAQSDKDAERVPMAAQLARYAPGFRAALASCGELSPRIAQLAGTYPVLLFALATRYGPLEPRRRAVQLAVDGRSLAQISRVMGLPLCFRRIPPEALRQILPYARWGADANRRLAPHQPVDAEAAGFWLAGISVAARYCDEEFAVWLARHLHQIDPLCLEANSLLPLALFAWQSRHGVRLGLTPPQLPWTARIGLRTTLVRTAAWLRSMRQLSKPDQGRRPDPWLPGGVFRGYEFRALMTRKALREEAKAMDNCVHSYFEVIEEDLCRLFSVRHRRRRVATIEIRRQDTEADYAVTQVKGPSNRNCALEVWHVVTAWLEHGNGIAVPPESASPLDRADRLISEFLVPYRRDLGLDRDDPVLCTASLPSLFMSVRRTGACIGRHRRC